MKTLARALKLASLALPFVAFAAAANAQESDVKKMAVDVRVEPAAHAANVRTTLTLLNAGSGPKQTLQFRVTGKAEVRTVTVGGQNAQFEAKDDKRYAGLKTVTVQLPSPIASRATADVVVDERITLAPGVDGAEISPGATVLLPQAVWVPTVNTQFVLYGANTAPTTVTVDTGSSEKAVSGGALSGTTFTQPLYTLPFVIAGNFDAPVTRSASGLALEAWVAAGASPAQRAGADRLLGDAEKIAAYYARVLGPAPAATFRIVATDDGAGFASASGVTLGRRVLERPSTDAETFGLLADALARVWVEGPFAVRGSAPGATGGTPSGVAVLHDALPRYLAVLAVGDRFGAPAEAEAFDRLRIALVQMGDVAAQVQLTRATPYDAGYYGLVAAKGPMAFRILERAVGRDALLGAVKTATTAARTSGVLTYDDFRAAVAKTGSADVVSVFTNWFETVVQPDLLIGVPQQTGATWTSALRNLGTGDVTLDVVATTDSGKRVTARATVPSQGFGQAVFQTSEHIATVEVDPDHLIPQTNYANDARPARPAAESLFAEGVSSVQRKEYAAAEEKLRQAVAADPSNASFKAWYARALLGLNRNADAAKAANEALAVEPIPLDAAAWANNVLGQVALASNDKAAATDRFGRAAAYAVESSALKTARDGAIAAGGSGTSDASVTKFFADFDRAVSAGVNTQQAEQYVDVAALPEFVRGLVTSLSRKWTTQVLRAEPLGADEQVVDARFTVTATGANSDARAVMRLRRSGDSWKLVDVQILESTENQPQSEQ